MSAVFNLADGAAILRDWLGDGGVPVPQEQAEQRAMTCVYGDSGRRCPYNVAPRWWETAVHAAAGIIKRHLEVKNQMGLVVKVENDLSMCRICGCSMPTKVWCPIEHVRAHTPDGQKEKYPAWCWQKAEL